MCELDAALRALSDARRRTALALLADHHRVALPDLAEHVAEAERGVDATDVPAGDVRDVYFSLYHTHVPSLVDGGFARYDQEHDLVVRRDSAAATLARATAAIDALHAD